MWWSTNDMLCAISSRWYFYFYATNIDLVLLQYFFTIFVFFSETILSCFHEGSTSLPGPPRSVFVFFSQHHEHQHWNLQGFHHSWYFLFSWCRWRFYAGRWKSGLWTAAVQLLCKNHQIRKLTMILHQMENIGSIWYLMNMTAYAVMM